MPPSFRYRYVDIGTVFTGDSRLRPPQGDGDSPSTLFANELACDVGGTLWGANEPLAIIDHHFSQHVQFPSACAAVLHKSALISSRFAQLEDVIWLVTHKDPDFDALCSMYLARRIIENDVPEAGWESYGLNPEERLDSASSSKIDWSNPDLDKLPGEHRWFFLLASYASMLETRRHISCPRARQLRSILYAALKRGRNFLDATSGATEFFDEVRSILKDRHLNPAFDSVLENSANFAPELTMLDREAAAYKRDLLRARKALVYLPEAEAPSPDFFEHSKKDMQQLRPEVSAGGLLLAESFRIATDGIYLRDPECILIQEWARVDLENSALGAGFEFTAIAYPGRRPEGSVNKTEYIFAIDPERANGRHLYTVWSRLQTEEVEALRLRVESATSEIGSGRDDPHAGELDSLLSNPWIGGNRRSSTLVVTPQRGTLIGAPGARSDLRDDPAVEAVRTELESPIYSASSLVAGPQIAVYDFAASRSQQDAKPRSFELNAPLTIPSLEENYFRFAAVGLRSDVPMVGSTPAAQLLIRQISESLWQGLHPEMRGELPADFDHHVVARADAVGVWSGRGIAIAQKPRVEWMGSNSGESYELRHFRELISLVHDIDRLVAEWHSNETAVDKVASLGTAAQLSLLDGEDLGRRALELQHALTLPNEELLRHFSAAVGFERLVARLQEVNQAAAEKVRRQAAAEECRRREKSASALARLQRKMRWLEVLVLTFVGLEIAGIVLRGGGLRTTSQQLLTLFGGPLAFACAAWFLQPWRMKPGSEGKPGHFQWILGIAVLVLLAVWVAQVLRWW